MIVDHGDDDDLGDDHHAGDHGISGGDLFVVVDERYYI